MTTVVLPSSRRGAHRFYLTIAGAGSLAVSLLHLAIIGVGPRAYRYFGAPQLAPLAEQGSWIPALATGFIAGVFAVFAAYAFSGAGWFRTLPRMRLVVLVLGLVYTLRGCAAPIELYLLSTGHLAAPHMIVFSLVSLLIGVAHLLGLRSLPKP